MKNPAKTIRGRILGTAASIASLVMPGCAPQENYAPEFYLEDNAGNPVAAITGAKAEEYGVDEVYEASLDKFPLVVRAEDSDGPELIGHVEPYQTNPPANLGTEVSRLNSGEGSLEWLLQANQTGPVADGERQIAGAWASDRYNGSRPSIGIGAVVCGVGVFYNLGDPLPPKRKTVAVITNINNHEIPKPWEDGDGKCDANLGEPYSSTDCSPTTDELVKSGHIKSYFVNEQGERIDTVTTNPATLRIWVSNQLDNRKAAWPTIVDPQENGQSDCIDIRNNYSQPQLKGSATYNNLSGVAYDTRIIFNVAPNCRQDEVAGFAVSLTTKDGDVIYPVIGSGFVPRTLPPYSQD
ncbi:hypothetical protein J4402_01490 [Candidatus Pacearchaeota archaeon]|nr:hypothetical protein [Candidatus Pacearchaeota archaeon]